MGVGLQNIKLKTYLLMSVLAGSSLAMAEDAFTVFGKKVTLDQIKKTEQGEFYKIEKERYELIDRLARQAYLKEFWEQKAKADKTSPEKAEEAYYKSQIKISDGELKDAISQFKDHPQLKELPKAEQEGQIRDYLESRQKQALLQGIFAAAEKKGDLKVLYPEPKEPVFDVKISSKDHLRYGPDPSDIKPLGCSDNCPITVVEYSEFQCPFCSRVMPSVKRLLSEYKGKVRWAMRDYPLNFHPRAKPAAVAAHCAGKQGKFYDMYTELFANQNKLEDADFVAYAGKIKGLDKAKWEACVKSPGDINALIEENLASGSKIRGQWYSGFFYKR